MTILHMSFFGSVLIIVVATIRALTVNKLPKRTFIILWGIVLFRLLVPYSMPSAFSVYSFISPSSKPPANADAFPETPAGAYFPIIEIEDTPYEFAGELPQQPPASHTAPVSIYLIIWLAGMILCGTFFAVSYLRWRFEFQTSLPVQNDFVNQWLKTHPLRRHVSVRQSDKIAAPMTYGIFSPVILMPKKTDWQDTGQLQFILLHEYMHICRYDVVTKLAATLALCIHWFNPLVWLFYFLLQRDIELACDESVVHRLGEMSKSTYAHMLIDMEAVQSGLMPFSSGFSKNAVEERITAIMKTKRTSVLAVFAAALLIIGVTAAFATSAADEQEERDALSDAGFSDEALDKLRALQFDGYEDMSVSEYQNKVWKMTDTAEYRDLLERFSKDDTLYQMKDSDDTAAFLFYTLEPLTAEKWQTREFGGYGQTDYPNASDNAVLEFFTALTIQNADTLTVGEYNAARTGMINGLQDILQNKTAEQLRNKAVMQDIISTEIESLKKHWGSDKLRLDVTYVYTPLFDFSEKDDNPQKAQEEQEKRGYPNGTQEDYRSLLALKTLGYEDMSVADFNRTLLEWANENYERMERINADIAYHDIAVVLKSDELSFVTLSVLLSGIENGEYVKSSYTGKPEADPTYDRYLPQKVQEQDGRGAWCDLYYQFSYHIADKNTLTVGARDRCISSMIIGIHEFWNGTDIETLLKMTKADIVKELTKIAGQRSSNDITITILEEQISFECMDERAAGRINLEGVSNADALKVRKEPSENADIISLLLPNQEVVVLSEEDEFYRILVSMDEDTLEGYVRKEYVFIR